VFFTPALPLIVCSARPWTSHSCLIDRVHCSPRRWARLACLVSILRRLRLTRLQVSRDHDPPIWQRPEPPVRKSRGPHKEYAMHLQERCRTAETSPTTAAKQKDLPRLSRGGHTQRLVRRGRLYAIGQREQGSTARAGLSRAGCEAPPGSGPASVQQEQSLWQRLSPLPLTQHECRAHAASCTSETRYP
jgi:hypothetical protein